MLCVWLPDWPVQRLRLEQPKLRSKAVALSVASGGAERLAACSSEARELGIRVGMRTPDAQALAGTGRLTILPHRPGDDRRALRQFAAGCHRFSPVVAIDSSDEPDAMLLDITGLAPLWGDPTPVGESLLVEAVAGWLKSQRLAAKAAVASTTGLALAAARYSSWFSSSHDNLTAILPADAGPIVQALPIGALRVEESTVDSLNTLGVDTVGQLMQLPRSSLPSRFGPQLSKRLDQLLGDAPEPIEPVIPEPPLAATWDFETAVFSNEPLENALGELLRTLSAGMQRRRCGALRVLITFASDSRDHNHEQVKLRLFRPTSSARELKELAALHTSKLRLRVAIRSIRVLIGSTAPLDCRQQMLFEDDPRDDPHELALLVNRLANRVGVDRVSRVEKRRSVDPERAFDYLPATDVEASRFVMTPSQAERALRLPLSLLGEAGVQVQVVTDRSGVPVSVDHRGGCDVVRYWGPERVETGWWRGRHKRRDAYWVELKDGQRLWLCLDLRTRRWRIAGGFC